MQWGVCVMPVASKAVEYLQASHKGLDATLQNKCRLHHQPFLSSRGFQQNREAHAKHLYEISWDRGKHMPENSSGMQHESSPLRIFKILKCDNGILGSAVCARHGPQRVDALSL